jgi:uncharacterized protein Veg
MYEFNLIVIKESVEEIAGSEVKSALEEGRKLSHSKISNFGM